MILILEWKCKKQYYNNNSSSKNYNLTKVLIIDRLTIIFRKKNKNSVSNNNKISSKR